MVSENAVCQEERWRSCTRRTIGYGAGIVIPRFAQSRFRGVNHRNKLSHTHTRRTVFSQFPGPASERDRLPPDSQTPAGPDPKSRSRGLAAGSAWWPGARPALPSAIRNRSYIVYRRDTALWAEEKGPPRCQKNRVEGKLSVVPPALHPQAPCGKQVVFSPPRPPLSGERGRDRRRR